MNLIFMKQKEIKSLKEKIWKENGEKCPVLDKKIPLEKMVLDHKHKLKNELPDEIKGAVRTSLEFRVNALFGKIENQMKRLGLDKDYDLPTILRNGADYLENGSYIDNGKVYIHPNEVPKEKTLGKRIFNKLVKLYSEEYPKRKPLEYPKNKKPSKLIKELSQKYDIPI